MPMYRGLMAGLGLVIIVSLAGCSEGSKVQLAEIEKLRRDTDKQMRLVREQNEQINDKLNLVKTQLDTIQFTYIPAVQASLDSVSRIPASTALQIGNDVDGKIRTIRDDYKAFKEAVNQRLDTTTTDLNSNIQTKLAAYEKDAAYQSKLVKFVLTKQDSVNREFAVRIDKRPWYKSILGDWDDMQRAKGADTP